MSDYRIVQHNEIHTSITELVRKMIDAMSFPNLVQIAGDVQPISSSGPGSLSGFHLGLIIDRDSICCTYKLIDN